MAEIVIGGLLVFAFLGMPIAFALGIASLLAVIYSGNAMIIIPQKLFTGLDSFTILAIPFFILAGNIMTGGGINKRIIETANAFVGWITGSLAMVTILASMIFAAISGSGVATVSAVGGITIPAMKKEGYPASFAAAVSASSAVTGPIIPPSIALIIYGSIVGISISDLFLASLIPGILLGSSFLLLSYLISKKRGFPKDERIPLGKTIKIVVDSIWALLMPVIILGGIFGGVFTPTEASVVSVVYAIIVGKFIYRELKLRDLPAMFADAAVTTGVLMLILGASKISGWVIVVSHVPELVTAGILSISGNPVMVILMINIILLIVGCLMDGTSAIVILTPILLPLVAKCGMSLMEFGVVMSFNLCMGMLTPPVGATLLLANDLAQEKLERTIIYMAPFFIMGLAVLALIIAVPEFMTYLPGLVNK